MLTEREIDERPLPLPFLRPEPARLPPWLGDFILWFGGAGIEPAPVGWLGEIYNCVFRTRGASHDFDFNDIRQFFRNSAPSLDHFFSNGIDKLSHFAEIRVVYNVD
jgi:hypothetical protein